MKQILFFAILLISLSTSSNAATVKVKINGVQKNSGNVIVGLFSGKKESAFPNGKGIDKKETPANGNTVNVEFDGVEPGTYAIGAYNDANKNNKLDKILGIPKEQYGNSGKRSNTEPTYAKSKFEVGSEDKQIEIDIH